MNLIDFLQKGLDLAHSSCVLNSRKVLRVSTQTNVVYCLVVVTFVEQNTMNGAPDADTALKAGFHWFDKNTKQLGFCGVKVYRDQNRASTRE